MDLENISADNPSQGKTVVKILGNDGPLILSVDNSSKSKKVIETLG